MGTTETDAKPLHLVDWLKPQFEIFFFGLLKKPK
jgi:hypothetical protein